MHRDNHGSPWELKIDETQLNFSVEGCNVEIKEPLTGDTVTFSTSGGSYSTPKFNNAMSYYGDIRCSATSPQNKKYIITAYASFFVNDCITFYEAHGSLSGSISQSL